MIDRTNEQLAKARQLLPRSIQAPTTLFDCEARLVPVTAKAGTAELLACLTLVAPSGMTAEDRQAWISVAKATLTGIPGDLLAAGCKKARETCHFPSEIVPTIMREVSGTWNWRKRRLSEERQKFESRERHIRRKMTEAIPYEETQRILREIRAEGRRSE